MQKRSPTRQRTDARAGYNEAAMPESPSPTSPKPQLGLQHVHQAVLAGLAASPFIILLQPAGIEPVPPARLTVIAICLAVGAVFARALSSAEQIPLRGRWVFGLLTLLFTAGIGAAGLTAALEEGARQIGLGLTLGAAILALRCPQLQPRRRR